MEESVTQLTDAQLQSTNGTVTAEETRPDPQDSHLALMDSGSQSVARNGETVVHDNNPPVMFSNNNTDCIKVELLSHNTKTISSKDEIIATVEKDAEDTVCADKEKSCVSKTELAELECCEYCGGPVKKRRLCSPLKRFCSKACAKSVKKLKQRKDDDSSQDSEDGGTGLEMEGHVNLSDYIQLASAKAAPESSFKHQATVDVPGLKPGMKLEAVDRNNPPSYCVATVVKVVGHRVCIRYDGYGNDDSNDFWCNFQAEELHPIGWCAQNGYPLQAPKGINSSLDDWRTFLTQTLTGALAAPQDLFKKSQDHFQPRVHGFEVGMKVEVIHPRRPNTICAATVTKSLGPYYFAVTTDFIHDIPTVTFCCHSDSPGIFAPGWSIRNGADFTVPASYNKKTFLWDKYLTLCRAQAAPSQLFKKTKLGRFKTGMKVEAVDLEHPFTVRVTTVIEVMGRLIQLFFDGQSRFQFLDVESPDIYPIGWCQRTGHPLETPFGTIVPDNKVIIPEGKVKIAMPSFLEVMGKHHAAQSAQTQVAAVIPRKSLARHENEKEKEVEKDLKETELKDKDDGSNETDSSDEDDATGSERFYHNKNQIFFNKGCCIGPLLDPEKVSQLPDATSPGKVSTVIRTGLEMVAKAARDPEKVIDLMQEGCGVRVVVKHKGKTLKKAISRVDSRPKLERYLKRFCRRLICCEFFLSLKPVGRPCPDQCKTDDQGNLLGPKGLKAKRSREYFEVKHLGFEKKKRGRKRKSDLLTMTPDPIVIKRQPVDSNTNGIQQHAAIVSGALTTCTAGATSTVKTTPAAPQPNGVVVQKVRAPVAVITPGVVRSVPTSPAAPGLVRMTSSLPMARTADIAAAPVISQVPRAVAAAPVQMSGGLAAAKQGIQIQKPQSAGISANKFNFSGIVANVSNQRFSTNAGSAGATITFGRAPPNVTIVSTNNSPLITKKSSDLSSPVSPDGTVATQNGQIAGQSQVVGVLDRGSLHYSFGGATSVAHVGPPPPYSQARAHKQIRATILSQPNGNATTVVYSGNEQMPPNQPGGATNDGHVRPTGMRSHVVKHTPSGTPPPPPLVPTTLFQPPNTNFRPPGPTTTTPAPSPTCPSTGTVHVQQPRCTTSNTVVVGAVATRGQQAAQNVLPLIGPPPPLTSAATILPDTASIPYGAGEARVVQSPRLTVSVNTRGLPTVTLQQGNPLSSVNGPRMIHHTPLRPHGDQPGHSAPQGNPQGLKPRSVIQPSQHSNIRPATVSAQKAHAPIAPAAKPCNQSHLSNVRSGTPLQPVHRPPSQPHAPGPSLMSGGQGTGKPRESVSQTLKNEKAEEGVREQCEDPEVVDEEKSSSSRKRNMWWLKKKRRRRSRLTYIKTKYKKKEDEGTSSVVSVVDELMGVPTCGSTSIPVVSMPSQGALVSPKSEPGAKIADQQPLYMIVPKPLKPMVLERPKRGRPPKGLLSPKLKEEPDLSDTIDFSHDPDWKVGVEDERRRGKIMKRKKRIKRGFTSPTAFSGSSLYTGAPLVKEIGSRLVATLPTNPPPLTVKSPPVSPRQNIMGEKRLSPKTGSYKGHHPFLYGGPVGRSPSPYYESPVTTSPPLKARMHRPVMAEAGTNTSLPGILNGKSLDLPANPATWAVEQVVQYVRATDCANYSNIFLEQEIDGQALMLLSRDSLMQFTRMKLGPTLKMCSYIAQLKARAR